MMGDFAAGYLDGLPSVEAEELARANKPGLAALRKTLASGEAVAFLGARASVPLYPMWDELITELVDAAEPRLGERQAATCRVVAQESSEEVVEIVRQQLGVASYREVLRQVLRVRTDPETGRSWTAVQELVCRCAFKAVVTTNYDPGIVNARMRVRSHASATGFTTWEDELALDRWLSGDVFGEAELPVLFAHGQHNRPDSVVLATTEYRRAYAGNLPQVLARLMEAGNLVWIGFAFADQRIAAVLREVADRTGTRADPGGAPRHVAVMAWDPAEPNDPGVLARRAEIAYGAQSVLYPAPNGDHSALHLLLSELTDGRFPSVANLPTKTPPASAKPAGAEPAGAEPASAEPASAQPSDGERDPVVRWVPAAERAAYFTGRAEELLRLDRWATDPQVALVGVTAWGGAGKTALVTQWVQEAGWVARRPRIRGVFGWSFYANPSAEHWARGLLDWARQDLSIPVPEVSRPAAAVLGLLRAMPLLLVLDGLEVVQEGPAGDGFGRLLDGTLREVLAGVCQQEHKGLVVLTSRFPFADLEVFDGDRARMLDVPPFTPAEGAALLAAVAGEWMVPEDERRALVRAVDGHALATVVLAGLLAARPPASDLAALRAELATAARTDARVGRVLEFYAHRLSEADRYLLAAVSLFARPVHATAVLAVAQHEVFGSRLAGWTPDMVQAAVRDRLGGLLSWHPDGTISAHPLVRDTFRRLAMDAAGAAAETALTGIPAGRLTSRPDALRVVEAIELLLDAGHWQAADDMHINRSGNGEVWKYMPAAWLGQRAATAFVATADRRAACARSLTRDRLGFYLNATGLSAMNAGDLATAREYLRMALRHYREDRNLRRVSICLRNLTYCLGHLGLTGAAKEAAAEALTCTQTHGDRNEIRNSHAYLGWVAAMVGDATAAEQQFAAADEFTVARYGGNAHLFSVWGTWWAEWLARTGRSGPAEELTNRNAEICRRRSWNHDLARCDRLLGRIALASGDITTAGERLTAAAGCFRDGDYLTELATTLTDLADSALAKGDLDAAEHHVAEAITIAAPGKLVPAHSAALAARSRIRAARAAVKVDPDLLRQGRDAADAAMRLAVRHRLAWHELAAMRAHLLLDEAEHADHGWAAKASTLHARLVPPGLDHDPLRPGQRPAAAD